MNSKYIKFYPVLLVWPIWLYTVITQDLWYDIFSDYWPATIGMILGSFIAGSTPLGGGVIAFPIAVLVLQFTSYESRDASVLVQSIGMNAAAFLLITTKSHLLNKTIIYTNIVFGCVGMLIGLAFNESPELTNTIYTVTVLCFGIIYFYTNIIDKDAEKNSIPNEKAIDTESDISVDGKKQIPTEIEIDSKDITKNENTKDSSFTLTKRDILAYALMGVFGIIGGFITASVGSGSDIAVFVFGIYCWNNIYPENKLDDNIFTASSVVVMGVMSALTVFTRAVSNPGFTSEVMLCFGAMSFVVVIGAPVGSLVLTPSNLKYLQYMFYCLAIIQFILFGVLKIGDNVTVWIITSIIVILIVTLLMVHYIMKRKRKRNRKHTIESQSAIKFKSIANQEKDDYDGDKIEKVKITVLETETSEQKMDHLY